MNKEEYLKFLKNIVLMTEGKEVCEKLERLGKLSAEIIQHIERQEEIRHSLVKEYNIIIRELYPKNSKKE